ncbi:AlpA family phage regulatory protein [Pseudoduganella sp. FT26W]|uniref:AlpA family phage regulatory protein n=2 Tax=Duganella aquatilis TaxID=2666082 RepID=A0A844D1S3_9BURK|nr:AlpA family phage regulatory protein [Duganella aquatilis]
MTTRPLTTKELLTPGRVLILRPQLLQKVPLSVRTIHDMEKRGEFPKHFTISPTKVAWDLAEVDAWIAERKASSGQARRPGHKKASS